MCDGSTYLGFGTASHLIDKDKRFIATLRQEQFHVLQVAAIGTQVVLDALLVTDVDKDISKDAHVGIVTQRGQQAALHHKLHNAHRLETHRLTAGIRSRNDQNTVLAVERDVQGHDFLALSPQ